MTALEFLIREPADVYHAKSRAYLGSHRLAEFRNNEDRKSTRLNSSHGKLTRSPASA